jgi:hypothetical protein
MRSIKSILKEGSIKYLSILLILSLGIGCKNTSDLVTPSYIVVPEGFKVLPGTPNPDFYASNQNIFFYTIIPTGISHCDTFKANLSHVVSWKVDLIGLSSGAVKRITGTSDTVKALWWGGNDGISLFRRGEKVEATLSFYGTELQYKDTVVILGTKHYYDLDFPRGHSIENMEAGRGILPGSWYNFHDPKGSAGIVGPAEEQIYNGLDSGAVNAVEGYGYYLFDGIDRSTLNSAYSTFFIMGAGFQQATPILSGIPNMNPDSLYFNVYVYGFGLPNTKFQVGFDEDDNSNGSWSNLYEDEIVYITRVDWTGWRLISFKYTDAKFSNIDPNGGAHGNRKFEPGKIIKMGFVMNSDPATYHAKVAYDFPSFTYGHPFNPNN